MTHHVLLFRWFEFMDRDGSCFLFFSLLSTLLNVIFFYFGDVSLNFIIPNKGICLPIHSCRTGKLQFEKIQTVVHSEEGIALHC